MRTDSPVAKKDNRNRVGHADVAHTAEHSRSPTHRNLDVRRSARLDQAQRVQVPAEFRGHQAHQKWCQRT